MNRHSSQIDIPQNPFASLRNNQHASTLETAARLSLDMVNLIQTQISQEKIKVNQVQKEFKLNVKNPPNSSQYKQEVQGYYEGEENISPHTNRKNSSLVRSRSQKKYFKSEMTQEDIENIKNLKKMHKKYQMELQKKAKTYEQNLAKFKEEERELLQRQKKQKNQQKLKEVSRKLEQIRQRQQQRNKNIQEEKRKITELKKKKKLYQKLDQHYQAIEKEELKKQEEIKLALKKQKNVDFESIKEHEKKYDEIMKAQREERERKVGDLTSIGNKKYYQSRILRDLIQEQQRAKAEHIDKKQELLERYTKEKQYGEYVRSKYLPNVAPKEEKDKNNGPVGLSIEERSRVGNQYMKQVNKQLAQKGTASRTTVQQKEEPFRYKDYLKEMRGDRKWSSHKESRYINQIESLMKKENMTQEQKFYQAKILAQKLEQGKVRNSQKLIAGINAKLHLLKSIEPQ